MGRRVRGTWSTRRLILRAGAEKLVEPGVHLRASTLGLPQVLHAGDDEAAGAVVQPQHSEQGGHHTEVTDFKAVVVQTEAGQRLPGQRGQLRVGRRPLRPDQLDAGLGELAVAPQARPFVAEHRSGISKALGQRRGLATIHKVATDGGRQLRAQTQVAAPIREGIELRQDVFARLEAEEVGMLQDRDFDVLIAVAGKASAERRHEVA